MKYIIYYITIIIVLISTIFFNKIFYIQNYIFLLSFFICIILLKNLSDLRTKNVFKLSQISLFATIATLGRCFVRIIPKSTPFLPIIILSSSNVDKNSGFWIGALSVFISNIFLGHGLWTPWQMLAAGLVGYLSGLVFHEKKVKPTIWRLSAFSVLCIVFVYSSVMNIYSFLFLINDKNLYSVLAYISSSFILDLVNATISIIFTVILYTPIVDTVRKINKIVKR